MASAVSLRDMHTVYTYTVCKGGEGVRGSGPQTDKHLPQSAFTGHFLRGRHFALPSLSLISLRHSPFQRSQPQLLLL